MLSSGPKKSPQVMNNAFYTAISYWCNVDQPDKETRDTNSCCNNPTFDGREIITENGDNTTG
jgi:hypothetical protein